MKSYSLTYNITQKIIFAAVSALVSLTLLMASFFVLEPQISHGQSDTQDFRIRQTINDETSFLVNPSNVTMSSSISGVTGGNATGTTQYVVRSNNASGYYVEIDFFDNAGAYAMRGDEDGGAQILDYAGDVGGQPSFNFTTTGAAQFAYSNYSSTTSDTDDSFLNNGSACNTSTTQTVGRCWKAPSTTGFRVVDRNSAATNGATSTLYFKVNVPSGASPTPTAQTYTATATLSVFIQ
jgi:hypothetical protein